MPMVVVSHITINTVPLEPLKAAHFNNKGGAEIQLAGTAKLIHDRWDGWIEFTLPGRYFQYLLDWELTGISQLQFIVANVKYQSNDVDLDYAPVENGFDVVVSYRNS